jgi:hypothetical protein
METTMSDIIYLSVPDFILISVLITMVAGVFFLAATDQTQAKH